MVTEYPPLYLGSRDYLLRFTSDLPEPLFRIWRDGVLIAQTYNNTHHVMVDSLDRASFEIRDDDKQGAWNVPYKGFIWWQGNPLAERYEISWKVGLDWVLLASVYETGESLYKWDTPVLENQTEYEFRVIAIDADGNQSEPLLLNKYVVRRPQFEPWDYTYASSTGQITVDLA